MKRYLEFEISSSNSVLIRLESKLAVIPFLWFGLSRDASWTKEKNTIWRQFKLRYRIYRDGPNMGHQGSVEPQYFWVTNKLLLVLEVKANSKASTSIREANVNTNSSTVECVRVLVGEHAAEQAAGLARGLGSRGRGDRGDRLGRNATESLRSCQLRWRGVRGGLSATRRRGEARRAAVVRTEGWLASPEQRNWEDKEVGLRRELGLTTRRGEGRSGSAAAGGDGREGGGRRRRPRLLPPAVRRRRSRSGRAEGRRLPRRHGRSRGVAVGGRENSEWVDLLNSSIPFF